MLSRHTGIVVSYIWQYQLSTYFKRLIFSKGLYGPRDQMNVRKKSVAVLSA